MVIQDYKPRWDEQANETKVRRDNGLFTYEELSFLLLILSTRTVIVMPMSTPAASNKAITLMTSLVAICGTGLSVQKTHTHQ